MEQMGQLDTFVQARLEETKPPMVSAARESGYRPSPEEDPLNTWMWKCRIEGAEEGLLAGKTVSYKDHIAVAGIPMSFGSFALEGFIPDFDATVVTRVLQEGGTIIGKNVMNGLSGGFGTGSAIGDYDRLVTGPGDRECIYDDLVVDVFGDTAYGQCTAIGRYGRSPRVEYVIRATFIYRKVSGLWKIIHYHESANPTVGPGGHVIN